MDDPNRRNTQQLVDFLRDKHFAGGVRPVVHVENISIGENEIDVIVVHNSDATPFYLTEKYQSVMSNNIYTRVMDSNTPKINLLIYLILNYCGKNVLDYLHHR
mgnify:CR=1 FL=1